MYGFIAWQLQAWQLWAVAATNLVLMLGGLISWQMAQRQHSVGALRLLIGLLIFGALLSVTFVGGIGILGAILVVMLGLSVASQGIPRHQLNILLIIIIVAAFVVIGVSFVAQPIQFIAPQLDQFITIASVAIIAVFSFFIIRQFGNYPLPTKLLVAFLGIVAVALAAQGFITNLVIRDELQDRVGSNLDALATSKAQEFVSLIESQVAGLRALSLNKFVQDSMEATSSRPRPDEATIQQLDLEWRNATDNSETVIQAVVANEVAGEFREYQQNFPGNVEVFATDKYGLNLAATNRTSDLYQADEDWWRGALRNGLYVGAPEFDASASTISVIIALPVRSHNGSDFVGILRTTIDLQSFNLIFRTGLPSTGSAIEIFLPDGAHFGINRDGQLQQGSEVYTAEQFALWFDETQPYQTFDRGNGTELLAAAPMQGGDSLLTVVDRTIGELGWHMVVTQLEAEALAPLTTITNTALAVVLGALLVAAVFAALIAQVLARPITRLTETAAKITGGDINALAPVEADDEVGALAIAINVMTAQIRETLAGLEARVAERTRAIAASAEVSRRLSTVLDRQKLVSEVVEQVQTAFGYYHVHIYFWDEAREHLVMAGGTGEAGQTMLANGHKIAKGQGLVGRAADTNNPVLVPNTAEDPNWLPNPLLPNTRAELAVPIALGERVLGVLDVQENVVNGLDREDEEVLQSLANQVAIATQNASTFAQTQRQADVEAMVNTIGQKIQSATTVEAAMQVAAREVGRALGGTKAVVRLKNYASAEQQPLN
jgi:putative methionine-R-sulfoxide reductase with GAF domain